MVELGIILFCNSNKIIVPKGSSDSKFNTKIKSFYPNHKILDKKKNCNLLSRQFKSSSSQVQLVFRHVAFVSLLNRKKLYKILILKLLFDITQHSIGFNNTI